MTNNVWNDSSRTQAAVASSKKAASLFFMQYGLYIFIFVYVPGLFCVSVFLPCLFSGRNYAVKQQFFIWKVLYVLKRPVFTLLMVACLSLFTYTYCFPFKQFLIFCQTKNTWVMENSAHSCSGYITTSSPRCIMVPYLHSAINRESVPKTKWTKTNKDKDIILSSWDSHNGHGDVIASLMVSRVRLGFKGNF